MNATELATTMLRWGELQRQADALAADIEAAVLAIGKTQTVGDVRATYSKERVIYDYEAGAFTLPDHEVSRLMLEHTQTSYDWKAICADAGVDAPVKAQGEPSVTVKFV